MADKKISQLTSAGALTGTEQLPIVQTDETVKTTSQDVADLNTTTDLKYRAFEGDGVQFAGIIDVSDNNKACFGVLKTEEGNIFQYGTCFRDTADNYKLAPSPMVYVYDDQEAFKTFQGFEDWVTRGYKYCPLTITQSGTSNPSVTLLRHKSDGLESVVWTRNAQGEYYGTLNGAFSANVLAVSQPIYSSNILAGSVTLSKSTANLIIVRTYDLLGALTDGLLTNQTIELKVFF